MIRVLSILSTRSAVRVAALMAPKVLLRSALKLRIAIPALLVLVALIFSSVWFIRRQAKISWARTVALSEAEQCLSSFEPGYTNSVKAYRLALEAEKYIPKDPRLATLLSRCSMNIDINTAPEGARVYAREYLASELTWQYLGTTPIRKIRLPRSYFIWKLEKEEYETTIAVAAPFSYEPLAPYNILRVLDKVGSTPAGMVRVAGAKLSIGEIEDFYIDRYEVTNEQYKMFIDAGGYKDKQFWKHEFVKGGKVLGWEAA